MLWSASDNGTTIKRYRQKSGMHIDEAKRRARSGPLMLFARRIFSVAITLLSTITIARLIAPRDYGLASMSLVIFVFAQAFREFGLTNAMMRKGHISQNEVSFLFWFNAAATIILGAVLFISASSIALFYKQPIIEQIVYVSTIGFLITGLSLQHRAVIARDLRFGSIALIDSVAQGCGFIITLALAFIRHDVWAIVIGSTAQGIIEAILVVWWSKWRPDSYKLIPEWKETIKFGANSFSFTACMFFADNSASILIGHSIGPSALGQYSRAQALYNLPNFNLVQPIAQAAMPFMARMRPYPQEYKSAYIGLVTNLCSFLFPMSVALTFCARPLIHTILGSQWDDAGSCFMMLAPSLAFYALGYSASDLFITQDRSGELRTLGLFEAFIRVGSIAIGVQIGLTATALAFTISNSVMAMRKVYVASRSGPVTLKDHFAAIIPAVPLAGGAAIGAVSVQILDRFMGFTDPALAFSQLGASMICSLIAGLLFSSSRAALLAILSLVGLGRFVRRWTA